MFLGQVLGVGRPQDAVATPSARRRGSPGPTGRRSPVRDAPQWCSAGRGWAGRAVWRRGRIRVICRSRRTAWSGSADRRGRASFPGSPRSSRRRVQLGCSIRLRPTRPEELARPSGCWSLAESSSSRGVPMPLAHNTTARAGWNADIAVAVDPLRAGGSAAASSVRILRTRAPVTHLAPALQRLRHVDEVEGGLGALRAAPLADTPAAALLERFVLLAGDGVRAGPPVPAEFVGGLRRLSCRPCPAGAAEGDSRVLRGRRCRRRRRPRR